jgi:hypothetical protein
MRPRANSRCSPSGRIALMVSTAPVWRVSAAVCVCVSENTATSGVWSKKDGVVSETPVLVLSVLENCHSVTSDTAEHGPSSRNWIPKFQSAPRVIVLEKDAGVILNELDVKQNRSNRLPAVRLQAMPWPSVVHLPEDGDDSSCMMAFLLAR